MILPEASQQGLVRESSQLALSDCHVEETMKQTLALDLVAVTSLGEIRPRIDY